MRTLFICKKNHLYGFSQYCKKNSGLFNSTRFIVEALELCGHPAKIVEVTDNNDIDREISEFYSHNCHGRRKDMNVVIEALWVVPEKFDVLKQLHPRVSWWIHLHSNMPFLANEGNSISWIIDCAKR